jgi:hypothetical protein
MLLLFYSIFCILIHSERRVSTPSSDFSQSSTVSSVRLRGCALETTHLLSLLPFLIQCNNLTHLDVSDNNLSSDGVEALIAALFPESRLQVLCLANNWFGPPGLYALAVALEANVGLKRLDVANTNARPLDMSRIDSDQHALKALADALQVYYFFPLIQCLTISNISYILWYCQFIFIDLLSCLCICYSPIRNFSILT